MAEPTIATNNPPEKIDKATKKQLIMAIFASCAGFSLDLFDLFLLLYVSPQLSKLIFPSSNPTLSLAAVYGAFAISMIIRPTGAGVFGTYADKHGRKKALYVTMLGAGIATTAMGLIPTYNQVGVWAGIIFLILRLLQGLFIGGVTASTHTIGTETVPASWRGWVSGVVTGGGGGLGAVMASLVFYTMARLFPGDAFDGWGWRCMFFTGLLSMIFALFIFKYLQESPLFAQLEAKKGQSVKKSTPVKVLFSAKYRKVVILNILLVFGVSGIYYLTLGYLPSFLGLVNKVPKANSGMMMMAGALIAFFVTVLLGQFSEMVGRRKAFFVWSIIGAVIFAFAGYGQLAGVPVTDLGKITMYVYLLAGFGNAGSGAILIFLNERFPTEIRASGTAISWNGGYALGGIMPMTVTAISPTIADIPIRLTIFCLALCALTFISAYVAPETKGHFE